MIKSVAQAIPSYAMSCFDITKALCDEISTTICRFWWAQQEKENKLHRVSREKLASRKEKGGLGYRDMHLFNLAMLAHQVWRLVQYPKSLCARLLKARYCLNDEFLTAAEGPGISYTWRSIIRGFKALERGLIWHVDDGTQVRIWEDPWIPRGVTRRSITPRGNVLLSKLSELIDPVTGGWDAQLVRDIF